VVEAAHSIPEENNNASKNIAKIKLHACFAKRGTAPTALMAHMIKQ